MDTFEIYIRDSFLRGHFISIEKANSPIDAIKQAAINGHLNFPTYTTTGIAINVNTRIVYEMDIKKNEG